MCIPKKCLKQRRRPSYPSLQQSRRYFRAEKVTYPIPYPLPLSTPATQAKVTWLRLLFAIEYAYPADRVTKRSLYRSP